MADFQIKLAEMRENIVNLREQKVLNDLNSMLQDGVPPWELMNCFNDSLGQVGQMFQQGTYFMTGLILAGEIMRQAMEVLMPHLTENNHTRKSGLVIIGTIEGDIHELGKNMAAWFLEADGFEVIDLGVDVPPRVFLKEILQREPDAVGVSLLLTSCVEPVKRLARLLKDTYNDRPAPPLFVGCGFLSSNTASEGLTSQHLLERQWLEVDHVVKDAYDTLRLCRELVGRKRKAAFNL
ncbi:MAG: cobalamin-dependent protein [Deltaproteobacteria bacterium]|jgi:methanogenic corrinoid protein MtbC1|nr:cobalamin-dependent protein [Deltaproteobacteria bacterium]